MKTTVLFFSLALAAVVAIAADVPPAAPADPKVDKAIQDSVPLCNGAQIMMGDFDHKMPLGLKAQLVRIESEKPSCKGQYIGVVSPAGGFYLGMPWFLDQDTGTIEEKLKSFTWRNMQENFTPLVDRTTKTREGLYRVTLNEMTERGNLPMEGEIDPAGSVFFLGHFRPMTDDMKASRLKTFEPYITGSPSEGAANAKVTIIEFSDFECPSCMHAAGYLDPILAKYPEQVRYIRYDLPLVTVHPWALTAAIAGRAVYHQKPELFWDYKKQVYTNQDKLNSFVIDDFVSGYAKDHDLNMDKFNADMQSAELKNQILKAAGFALSNDIRATPSYMVNGAIVDPGAGGSDLERYVASLLK